MLRDREFVTPEDIEQLQYMEQVYVQCEKQGEPGDKAIIGFMTFVLAEV